jgi:transposase-like protein
VIVTAVRWSCRFRPSLVDVRDVLGERGIDGSPRAILSRVQKLGPLVAAAVRRAARPVGRRWYCDETYVRVAGRWADLYRAVDDHGQVIDVLLREPRDLVSARALFAQAIRPRRGTPDHVVTDEHRAYVTAVRGQARHAVHTRTGVHRARGETTKPIARGHVPIKDRLRPMRGLQSVATGQRLLEGIELARAVRRGHIHPDAVTSASPPPRRSPHARAREAAAIFSSLARR